MTALIDTHLHLIYPEVAGYGWTDDIAPLTGKAFTLETYRDLTRGTDIRGSLFMETGVDDADFRTETRHVADLAIWQPADGLLRTGRLGSPGLMGQECLFFEAQPQRSHGARSGG